MRVTAYLMGGCANQMFEYAAGYALAKKRNAELFVDRSRFEEGTGEFRMYSLGLFQGTERVPSKRPDGSEYLIKESGLPYNPALFENIPADADVWMYGYWQTEKYFVEYKEDLKRIFTPKKEEDWPLTTYFRLKQIREAGSSSVFLTVRRTDYVNNPFHGVLGMDYYNAALDLIASKVGSLRVFIFSDEPEWCQENIKLKYPHVVAGNFDRTVKPHLGREDVELFLMRNCQHAVMANSSYSWWGAWLGKADQDGIVVAPKRWFLSDNADPRDIVPERWLRV